MLNFVFRTDASFQIGTGHLIRCLTLAEKLRDLGHQVRFICRELPGHLCELVETNSYPLYRLALSPRSNQSTYNPHLDSSWTHSDWEEDAFQTREILKNLQSDWLIVDHYHFDIFWEQALKPYCKHLMAIDDLANRKHSCDVLLDQNFSKNPERRYQNLVPHGCKMLLGPYYSLLRKEFVKERNKLHQRDGRIRNILIFFGGIDATNETSKAIRAIEMLQNPNLVANVVVGKNNPHRENIRRRCLQNPNLHYYCQVENMASLMAKADLAIGAGGTTTWERCFLGLPSLLLILAENQIDLAQTMDAQNIAFNLGWHHQVKAEKIASTLQAWMQRPDQLLAMSENALALMGKNNRDPAQNVAEAILEVTHA